jgi:hypothetical protein
LFYRCNYTMASSLVKPDLTVMGPFQNLPEFFDFVEVPDVTTVRLDDVPEAMGADYLKLDVQGSEGQVLAGARTCLDSVLVVHSEVEFVPIYAGQPLFGDIDAILRSRGFVLHRLLNLEGRTLRESASSMRRARAANSSGQMRYIFARQVVGAVFQSTAC